MVTEFNINLGWFFLGAIGLVIIGIGVFLYNRRNPKNCQATARREPIITLQPPQISAPCKETPKKDAKVCTRNIDKQSPYNPGLVILQLKSFAGKPYMGYELHQALLDCGLRLGDANIFHRYAQNDKDKILFSLAAATASGEFAIEEMGFFKCDGLVLFMHLASKQKLMAIFDIMLDTARQLVEELGGEIYDDLHQPLGTDNIRRLREKICTVETNNLYSADLLDTLNEMDHDGQNK